MVLPRVRFRDAPQLAINGYAIQVFGVQAVHGEIMGKRMLAIRGTAEARPISESKLGADLRGLPAV